MKNKLLYEPFENIPTRKGRGGVYPYVKWSDVADRMNDVFGTNWSSEVMFQDIIGNNVIVRVRVSILNPENNMLFIQEGFGGAINDASSEAGNPFKSAYSKALKDACKKWGVALYLDDDDDQTITVSSTTVSTTVIPKGYVGVEHGVPSSKPITPHSMVIDVPVQETSTRQPAAVPVIPTATPTVPSGVTNGPSVPSQQITSVPNGPMLPPKSVQPSSPAKTSPMMSMPPSISALVPPSSDDGPTMISEVQKTALHNILNIKGVEYKSLAEKAFEADGIVKDEIPEIDNLTYSDATVVIKYGNNNFRRK